MISIILNGIKYNQNENGHVIGIYENQVVFHAQYNRIMTSEQLRNYVINIEKFKAV